MISVKIEVSFDTQDNSHKETITIPYTAKVRFIHDERGYIYFAYEINGHLYRPFMRDIRLFQKIYGVKSYKCLSEYLKGETLEMIKTHF